MIRSRLGRCGSRFRAPPGDEDVDALLQSTLGRLGRAPLTVASDDPLATLTTREREALSLVAQGLSNAAIAQRLVLSRRTVDNHIHPIMNQLGLPESGDDNHRVHAVLTYLRAIAINMDDSTPAGGGVRPSAAP